MAEAGQGESGNIHETVWFQLGGEMRRDEKLRAAGIKPRPLLGQLREGEMTAEADFDKWWINHGHNATAARCVEICNHLGYTVGNECATKIKQEFNLE